MLLNVVELTETPPVSVVPVTNHFAFAPFLKPLRDLHVQVHGALRARCGIGRADLYLALCVSEWNDPNCREREQCEQRKNQCT